MKFTGLVYGFKHPNGYLGPVSELDGAEARSRNRSGLLWSQSKPYDIFYFSISSKATSRSRRSL
ncbi:hypothetical protein SAY87_023414 [Trapa incisa]|uniref:Uncharacterized protein n=1 Tax=Trapa incisa TaxID=236973 RepID=A0AAN7KSI6_9MYRT|nr:hypothetical protein SAY87_023414 [Trapa incisa]